MRDIYQHYQHQTCEYYTESDLYKYHSILQVRLNLLVIIFSSSINTELCC